MSSCPHCTKEITHLPGFISEANLQDRINKVGKAKGDENALLTQQVTDLKAKVGNYDAVVQERDRLQGENTAITQGATRSGALRELGLDDKHLKDFETLHRSADADEKIDFVEWLTGPAREHVFLSHLFTGAPPNTDGTPLADAPVADTGLAGLAARAAEAVKPVVNANPNLSGARPPGAPAQKEVTGADLAAYFQTPAFQNLSSGDKHTKMAELQEKYPG